jgi:folate-dependent phosphoribosylglycinamide formyltransferase PurN
MKIVLLTSTSYRHKYVANKLSEELDIALIITEAKSKKIEDTSNLDKEDSLFVKKHFFDRSISEQEYFSNSIDFKKGINVVEIFNGEINSQNTFLKIKAINPERIVLFGTSIIKDPIINNFKNKIINLHLGLSPYYKGSATNLFPLLFNEVECIGATIHIATEKVDDGPILHQIRPDLSGNETIHDIGNKVILKSGEILPLVVKKHILNELNGEDQKRSGKIFKIADLDVLTLKKIYSNIEKGLVYNFIQNHNRLCEQKPIIEMI